MFGSDHYGMKPDIITIAKGLTSAYAPLSGSIVSADMWKVLEEGTDKFGPIGHGWTYSAHPICAAAGVANLELIDKLGLVGNAGETGAYLQREDARSGWSHMPMWARCAARACCAPSNSSKTATTAALLRSGPQDRPGGCRGAAEARASSPVPCRRATSLASRRRFA